MMTPVLSFLYPCFNRADLFARTLDSFVLQGARDGYEILAIDDGGSDNLFDVVRYYAAGITARFRLPVRYLRIDVDRLDLPVWHDVNGGNSPTVAWNVGVQQAAGVRVAVSSPEITHRSCENVARLINFALPPWHAVIADVYDRTWAAAGAFEGWISGGPTSRALCFLAMFRRQDLLAMGGFEEAFVAGRAFDDNEFNERFTLNGGTYRFTEGRVVAEHLPHARPELPEADNTNFATFQRLRGQKVANAGREWGSAKLIVEQWPC